MRRQLLPALRMVARAHRALSASLYPLAMTGVGQVALRRQGRRLAHRARRRGRRLGAHRPGLQRARVLPHPARRPPARRPRRLDWSTASPSIPSDLSLAASGGSNLGPPTRTCSTAVEERAAAYREANGLADDAPVPVDAVTASGSGLDPHISVANARLQAARVAEARGLRVDDGARRSIDEHTDGRSLGFLGEPGVNVLELNLALDAG